MTAGDILTLVREMINDEKEDYRFSDAEVYRAMDEAQREMVYERPATRMGSDGTYSTLNTLDDSADVITVDTVYKQALAHLVCSKLYVKDGEDDQNLRLGDFHYKRYLGEI